MSDIDVKPSLLTRVKTLQASSPKRNKEKTNDRQLMPPHLPEIGELYRTMPNHIARSSLFAPIGTKPKQIYNDVTLVSRQDAVIKFSGEQLDESQADVWMQVMFEASKFPLGHPVEINRSKFLQAIGRTTTGTNFEWLHRSMEKLVLAILSIQFKCNRSQRILTIGKNSELHLINSFDYDDKSQKHILRIDPRWSLMYRNNEYSLIDWSKRLKIGHKQDMAKSLQRLISTSSDEIQYYSLEWLKEKFVYTGRLRDFKPAIVKAMKELTRLKIITEARIEKSKKGNIQTVWRRLKNS